MAEKQHIDLEAAPASAKDLRMQLLQRQMEEMEKERQFKAVQEQKLTDFAGVFLEEHVTPEEVAVVRRLVANAVRDGKFEAMVYSFLRIFAPIVAAQ